MIFVDDISPFGTFQPKYLNQKIIAFTRKIGASWLAKRLVFILRKCVIKLEKQCIDTILFGSKLRLYTHGNICEKRALFSPASFDFFERKMIAELQSEGAVFVDIGANVGLYSIYTASEFAKHPSSRVIAVEPHPEIVKRLRYNCSLNPDLPIEVVEGAIADSEGESFLMEGEDNLGQSCLSNEGHKIKTQSLLHLLKAKEVTKVSALKVDVEGAEEAVLVPFLQDAPDDLLPHMIIIEENYDNWDVDIPKLAESRGYSLFKKTKMNMILTRG